jgi:HAD superfamily hydrolase (TIGR01459 family)
MNGFATRRRRSRHQKLVVALAAIGLFMVLMIFQSPHQQAHSFTSVSSSSSRCRRTTAMPTTTNSADGGSGGGGSVDAVASTTTTISSRMKQMQRIDGLSDIVDRYDTFILDMWGVLHDGKQPYRSVLTTLQRLHDEKKRLIILSNSSKRQDQSIRMLTKLGFDIQWFDHIITSGEYTHGLLNGSGTNNRNNAWLCRHLQNYTPKTCFCLGSGDGDRQYIESCTGWTMVDSIEQASLLLARGTFTIHETVFEHPKSDIASTSSLYQTALTQVLRIAARRKLPMIIANPDFIRPDGDRSPMPGSIGAWYRQILKAEYGNACTDIDDLIYAIGKPFPIVFDAIFKELFPDDDHIDNHRKSRVCMVGDALETDILGGQRSGIDTVWVTADGIHECHSTTAEQVLNIWNHDIDNDDNDNSQPQFRYSQRGETIRPTYQLNHFQW